MSDKFDFGGVNLGVNPWPDRVPVHVDTPFRMLIVGDFSGRGNRGHKEIGSKLAVRKVHHVDRDNLDEVMQRLRVGLDHTIVDSANAPVSIRFRELDDFEPDALFESVALFESLRILRQKLMNKATFAEAAAEVKAWTGASETETPAAAPEETAGSIDVGVSLGNLLDNTIRHHQSPAAESERWETMIRKIVEPHIIDAPDARQDALVECVDAAISQSMRQLLHHPDFQKLESAWRGLYLLIKRLETGRELQLHLLDVSKVEIAEDLARHCLSESALYSLLVEQSVGTVGCDPWASIMFSEPVGADSDDLILLGKLGHIAAMAGAPLIGAAKGALVGCSCPKTNPDPTEWATLDSGDSDLWDALRRSEVGSNIALLWPGFRGRIPFGDETRSIDSFSFEELSQSAEHNEYLWCSPVFAAALVIGQAFTQSGWQMQPGEIDEIDDLPLCYEQCADGDLVQLASAELWLSSKAAEKIRNCGITPLMSIKGKAAIRVGSFLSLNGAPLSGGWTQ